MGEDVIAFRDSEGAVGLSTFSARTYPTHEAVGFVWAYLPNDTRPPPPAYEWLRARRP